MRIAANRVGLCALIVSLGWPAAAGDILAGSVTPTSGLAPRDVTVHAIVEPDALNRALSIVVDSGSFYASSTLSLEGSRAPRARDVTFRMLPAGWYDVQVRLLGADGERASLVRTVQLY